MNDDININLVLNDIPINLRMKLESVIGDFDNSIYSFREVGWVGKKLVSAEKSDVVIESIDKCKIECFGGDFVISPNKGTGAVLFFNAGELYRVTFQRLQNKEMAKKCSEEFAHLSNENNGNSIILSDQQIWRMQNGTSTIQMVYPEGSRNFIIHWRSLT